MAQLDYKTGMYLDRKSADVKEANPPFIQFYKHSFGYVRKLMLEYPTAANVFMFLVENMGDDNALIVSQSTMADYMGLSRRTIQSATNYLFDNKYIDILKTGTSNIYCINADIAWQQSHSKKKFAKFAARVIISESEQGKIEKDKTARLQIKPAKKQSKVDELSAS
jgi:hypothetical protein